MSFEMLPGSIRVRGLGKRYLIGPGAPSTYGNFRERLMGLGGALRQRLRTLRRDTDAADATQLIEALAEVSFDVEPGEIVGLIGRNGAGKSTLLKVLSRITAPTSGHVEFRGRVGSLLEVGTGFHGELSGRENIFLNGAILGMSRQEIAAKLDAIVSFAEVERFLDTPVKHFSSGMYVRLAFSVAAHMETDILLVDEVLAVGDAAFQRKCLGRMGEVARSGRTVIFVSHNMGSIARLCERGLVLEGGELAFDGHVEQAIEHYNRLVTSEPGEDVDNAHVIFAEEPSPTQDFAITKVELLATDGTPSQGARTWDDLVVRVHARCLRSLRGAVVLEVRHASGPRLLYLATEPDRGQPIRLAEGEWYVDCHIRALPLAAGEYYLGASLAIPEVEYLWHRSELARLTVHPSDVFASGTPPQAGRGLVAADYDWRMVTSAHNGGEPELPPGQG